MTYMLYSLSLFKDLYHGKGLGQKPSVLSHAGCGSQRRRRGWEEVVRPLILMDVTWVFLFLFYASRHDA